MPIIFPPIDHIVFSNGGNRIVRNYGPIEVINDYAIEQGEYFKIRVGERDYYLTSSEEANLPPEYTYVLLTSKKPTRRHFQNGSIIVEGWLRHPLFEPATPEVITDSWKGRFQFIKEEVDNGIDGLRSPQLGALYAILAHIQHAEDKAIIVMPTGTGKTEVMLSALVAIPCVKLLVTVPSDALRSQLVAKFLTLGLLKKFGILPPDAQTPIVGVMKNRISDPVELENFLAGCNVVVTTMALVAGYSEELKAIISSKISQVFVDEAHHSEADTWNNFISSINYKKVFLFTATPYRTDERRLQGKFIFNFSLRAAQEQKYYKQIKFLSVREYDSAKADKKIAALAVRQLETDRQAGFPHMLMARCGNKRRAAEVAPFYQSYTNLRTVVVYTGAPELGRKIQEIKDRQYDVIICVDMLGEGFDLPELKIAAIHDERQSIPITLQFVGRFTRTSFDTLGDASFVANVAYPPIRIELDRLYAHDADWNLLLPNMSAAETEKQINFRAFLDGFTGLDNSVIPFQHIRPAMSTMIFENRGTVWNPTPQQWKQGIPGIDDYDHQYSNVNGQNSALVIILGRITKVDWGNFDTVRNMEWDMIVVFWDLRPGVNRVFVNFSMDNFNSAKLVNAVFGEQNVAIKGMDVFRIFHNVKRLSVYNFGGRPGSGGDISFRSFFGRGIQDGLSLLEQGALIKNNIFGAGYKEGEKVTLGCSISGKIWSYERGNLQELTEWCCIMGDIITDETIDTDTVLRHTLAPKIISERPPVIPIAIDWNPFVYGRSEDGFGITISNRSFDLSSCELNVVDVPIGSPLRFSLDTDNTSTLFELTLGERLLGEKTEAYFEIRQIEGPDASIAYGKTQGQSLADFFMLNGPIIWFADGSQLMQNLYVPLRDHPGRMPLDNIIPDGWTGVNLRRESQGIAPYDRDSIQYYFIAKIIDDFEIVYDDDASGEIADIIGINDHDRYIDVHLYHLKFAQDGQIGNNIGNLYQVCGQAQKSLNWKYRKGREFFNHLLRRMEKTKNGNTCSRLAKGTEVELEKLLLAAKWEKEMRMHVYIAQPGFSKQNVSDDILLLLGATYHYLATVGNIELKVYSS